MTMLHVGKDKAYDIMKYDENYVDDMWYCYDTHNCIVEYDNMFIAYKYDPEASNDEPREFYTFEQALVFLHS